MNLLQGARVGRFLMSAIPYEQGTPVMPNAFAIGPLGRAFTGPPMFF
jgi:hypothetical protein